MKRLALVLVVILSALPALAANEWWSAYERGMKAVETSNWAAVSAEMKRAIAIKPHENASAVVRGRAVTYLPHYWLGVALYHLDDPDAAVREWKTSDSQGAIQRTDLYSDLRKRIATVQTEKAKAKARASDPSRSRADAALDSALKAQIQAMTGGADQTDTYRAAQRKLQDARRIYNAAGNDPVAYQTAASEAGDARALFEKATSEARERRAAAARPRQRSSQPPAVAPKKEPPRTIVTPKAPENVEKTQPPATSTTTPTVPVTVPPKREEIVRKQAIPAPTSSTSGSTVKPEAAKPVTVAKETPPPASEVSTRASKATPPIPSPTGDGEDLLVHRKVTNAKEAAALLRRAWLRFARGDVNAAEALMTAVIDTDQATPEAYLIRGCARYTRGVLTNRSDLVDAARRDFIVAIEKKPSLRLDDEHFSPKLIAFFEETRTQM